MPPIPKRAAGRPMTKRYKGWEGGKGCRMVTCKRCHQKGQMKKICNETVLDPNVPPPAPPKPKRVRNRSKKAVEVQPQSKQTEAPSTHIEASSLDIQTTPRKPRLHPWILVAQCQEGNHKCIFF
jgi:hypothetical protein